MGSGDKCGLFINHELSLGMSWCCETYNNEQLSKKETFDIAGLEVWSIV